MTPRLLKKYERELEYLYEGLGAFERARPREAEILRIAGGRTDDPEIRRLLDGVALLSARLALEDEQSMPRLIGDLMRVVDPLQLSPFPSVCAVQLDAGATKELGKFIVPRGETITFLNRLGGLCRFSVAQSTAIQPILISDSRLVATPFNFDLPESVGLAKSALRFTVSAADQETPLSALGLEDLDLFLMAGQTRNKNLLGAIQNRVLGVGLFDDNKRLIGSLPAEAFYTQIKNRSFDLSNILNRGGVRNDPLRDIIGYPLKESFLKLEQCADAMARCDDTRCHIYVFFDHLPNSVISTFERTDVQTHVFPAINGFRCETDAAEYSFEREDCRIVPTERELDEINVLNIEKVFLIEPDEEHELPEFCKRSFFEDQELPSWQEQLQTGRLEQNSTRISFSLNQSTINRLTDEETEDFRFYAELVCSNGGKAAQVPVLTSASFDNEVDVPGLYKVITEPTKATSHLDNVQELWSLLSLISLNLNSVIESDDPSASLKVAILSTTRDLGHEFADAIRSVNLSKSVGPVEINGRYFLASGTLISITIGEGLLPVSDEGFSTAIAHYLQRFCSFDRFIDLEVRYEGQIEPFIKFDRLIGSQ